MKKLLLVGLLLGGCASNQTEVEKLREEALDAVKTEQDPSKPVKVSEQTEKQAMEFADTVDAVNVGKEIDINFDRIIAGEDILKVYKRLCRNS